MNTYSISHSWFAAAHLFLSLCVVIILLGLVFDTEWYHIEWNKNIERGKFIKVRSHIQHNLNLSMRDCFIIYDSIYDLNFSFLDLRFTTQDIPWCMEEKKNENNIFKMTHLCVELIKLSLVFFVGFFWCCWFLNLISILYP